MLCSPSPQHWLGRAAEGKARIGSQTLPWSRGCQGSPPGSGRGELPAGGTALLMWETLIYPSASPSPFFLFSFTQGTDSCSSRGSVTSSPGSEMQITP